MQPGSLVTLPDCATQDLTGATSAAPILRRESQPHLGNSCRIRPASFQPFDNRAFDRAKLAPALSPP